MYISTMSEQTMNIDKYGTMLMLLLWCGCGESEPRPVDLFPEDECAHCRMSVSDPKFASEIISQKGEIFKFDDLLCLEKFRKKRTDVTIEAMFVKDFETMQWLRYEKSIIIQTGIETPMGSGKVAVSTNERADAVKNTFPVNKKECSDGCCGT